MRIRFYGLTFLSLIVIFVMPGCGGGSVGGDNQSPDPTVQDFPLAYVKRPLPLDDNGDIVVADLRRPEAFNPGAVLLVRDRAQPSANERNISDRAFTAGELYDVKDIATNYDGTKFIFAMRAPEIENADPEDQPTWNIWEYTIASDSLRRIISDNVQAEEGQDISPAYLPDGRIVFSSTRQSRGKAILVDEGKPQFDAQDENSFTSGAIRSSFVLHVMDEDGGNIQQISFNQSHDLDPTVLSTGEIIFSRWEGAGSRSQIHLYSVRADGTDLNSYYGAHSHNTGSDDSTIQFCAGARSTQWAVAQFNKTFSQ